MSTSDGSLFLSDPRRLCILFEPSERDLMEYPFLQKLGGVMQIGRHPVLKHYCNVYNAFAFFRRQVAVMQDLGIPETDEEYLNSLRKKQACLRQLLILKSDSGMFKMEDLMPGGKFFSDPDFQPEETDTKGSM